MRGSQIILVLSRGTVSRGTVARGTVARGTVARDTFGLLIFMLNQPQCCLVFPFESGTVTLNNWNAHYSSTLSINCVHRILGRLNGRFC